jgi:FKBP-type peptidyl-prolyl cis-trans isomerase FkpA
MRLLTATASLLAAVLLLCGCEKKSEDVTYTLSPDDNAKFLADNGKRPDVHTTASGLQYRIINTGHGRQVTSPGDVVTVTYKGWTIDKHVFDRTEHGQTASFPAGGLIPGWVESLKLMHAGDEWQLVIPPDLGYGAEGAGADIPPNQVLVFNMQLISVHKPNE